MASTVIRGAQIKDSTVQRHDLDTSTVGQAVVTKLVQGSGVTFSSTGADSGTGDVTVSTSAIPLASSSSSGLMNQTSGNTTDFIDGTNASQPLQPVIWSATRRVFQAIGNPTFEVDQRNVGTVVTNPSAGTYIVDRFRVGKAGTMTINAYQNPSGGNLVVPGTNFRISSKFFRITLTGQQTTLGATDHLEIVQTIEGSRMRELIGDAHSLSVLVYSPTVAPLKFGIGLRDVNPSTTKCLCKLGTIPTSATWTLITLSNLPVWDPAGNWNIVPGIQGYELFITLAAGSSFTAPANDVWQSGNFLGAVGQDNFASKAVNTELYVGFAQHEPGALCTTLIDCSFTANLDDCLRYFCKSYDYAVKPGTATTTGRVPFVVPLGLLTLAEAAGFFPKPMAKAPSIGIYNPADGSANSCTDNTNSGSKATSSPFASERIFSQFTLGTASTAGALITAHYTADTGW